MKLSNWKFTLQPKPWDLTTNVYLIGYDFDGPKQFHANPIEFTEFEEGASAEPFFILHEHSDSGMLQAMMDGLWDSGLRPSNHRDFTQELQATKTHLEDMRQLVFKDKLRKLI